MITDYDIFKDKENGCFQLSTHSVSYAIEFDNEEKENIFLEAVSLLQEKEDLSLSQLTKALTKTANKDMVLEVLSNLADFDLLPTEWAKELGVDTSSVYTDKKFSELDTKTIVIIGDSPLSTRLHKELSDSYYKPVLHHKKTKDLTIDSIQSLIKQADLVVLDSNQWSPYHIELVNKIALDENKPWLFIGGIDSGQLKIGPLFYGKETGCYNCLISRVKSNHEYPTFFNSYEQHLKENKKASKPDKFVHEETMYSVLANMAMLEIFKFFESWAIPSTFKTLLTMDIFNMNIQKHNLLKKPYCEVCHPKLEYSASAWLESVTLK
ncbi:bacteriocin biosynthesis cyclodehydratase domain protein [Bernardetia litoralis DSM 6794]|uniref:Bacteriocin biosynthesis cyclodehydratase domain protein n=1 Tax=Bernardetia litoralis (strain ATCC 23117 / DSM 6794 / NBRC 15988 / NCIMB 1366 / Fx l1 / Sio-4) TaxID=880071 RepID=I4AIB6_BERLS|nr:TOMM precursor leader peptide-binding protein [Bernardetia litoralis]AFM03701.1 bacteriocin biosynthesis cyclodehydratase domain protein [Bernardetia litoralis DSM 6794]